jgi:hypothetical protein
MAEDDLRNADLSNLRFQDMNAAQKAEMRRRYAEFISRIVERGDPAVPQPAKKVRKWVPGTKR